MTKTALFSVWILAFGAAALPRSTEIAIAAQDKFALKAPSGISFSEFRGYEDWPTVAASQTEDGIKVIAANTTMIAAYRAGIPDNGALFPEGAKIVKIEWSKKRSAEAPAPTWAPDTLRTVEFIEKDSARFPSSNGWDMRSSSMMRRPICIRKKVLCPREPRMARVMHAIPS
jgi:Cytochrome P460